MTDLIDILNRTGDSFCGFALTMLIQSGILIVLLYLIDLLIRKHARAVFRYCIWMLIFVKLILPPTLSLPTGIAYWCNFDISPAASQTQAQPPSEIAAFESLPLAQPTASFDVQTDITAPGPETADKPPLETTIAAVTKEESVITSVPSTAAAEITAITWQAGILISWLVGVFILSALLLQRFLFVKSLLAQSDTANERLQETLDQCRKLVGVNKKIELRLSKNMLSPAACGLFNPVILMPASLLENLSNHKLRTVLIHEFAHIKRGDLWVNFLQTALQIVYFYNPLLWIANAVVRGIREKAVDEMVLTKLGDEAGSYSNTLLDIAEVAFSRPHFSLRLIGVVESKSALTSRIKHILSRPFPKSARLGLAGLAAIFIAAVVLLPMAKGNSAKDKNDWTKPTERWKVKSIKKTSLESFFGGWKNLSFEISAEEEQSVKKCTKLLIKWYSPDAIRSGEIRKELESVLLERPSFFYPEFLLGMWHRDYGDKQVGRELIKKAYEHAPVILVQKYQDENGEPITGLEIQTYNVECNKVKKGSLSQFDLKFRDLIADDDGCIYVPVYDTVYRRSATSLPSDYNIAYPTLGWFKAKSKVALMPIAKNNSTDGGLYEKAKASDKEFKVKVGPTEFEAHSVIRWQRNGNVVIKNPDGSEKRVIGMETPDYSSQAKWMDIAQVRLSPAPENYEVIELRVFDHAQRELLSEKDYLAVGYNRRDVSVNLYSIGQLLPKKIDVWMRVLHKPDTTKVWRIKPQANATTDIEGNTLKILDVKDGGGYSYSGSSAGIKWGKHDSKTDGLATTISLKFDLPDKDKYQICAVSKDHKRYVPDSPHFVRGANGIQVLTFGFPKDQIAYFEVSPFISRDTFYFDGIKLPEVSDKFEPIPEVTFQINGKEGKFTNIAFAPFELELQTFKRKRVTGLAVSDENWRCSFSTADAYDRTCGFAFKAPGLSMKIPKFQYYDKQGNYIATKYTHQGSGHGKTLTMAYNSINLPIEKIHSVGLQIGKKESNGEEVVHYDRLVTNEVEFEVVDVYFQKNPENTPANINTNSHISNNGNPKVRMDFIIAEPVVGQNVDVETFTQIKNLLGHEYFSAKREPGTVESVFNRYAHQVSEDKYKRLVELLVSRGYLRIISKPSFTLYDKQSSTITISGDKERAIPDISMTVQPEIKIDPDVKSREVVLLHTTFISQHSEEFKQSIEAQNRVTHNGIASLIDLNGTYSSLPPIEVRSERQGQMPLITMVKIAFMPEEETDVQVDASKTLPGNTNINIEHYMGFVMPVYDRNMSNFSQYIGGNLKRYDTDYVTLERLGLQSGASPEDVFEKHAQCAFYMKKDHIFVPIRGTIIAPVTVDNPRPNNKPTWTDRIKTMTRSQVLQQMKDSPRITFAGGSIQLQQGMDYGIITPDHRLVIMRVDDFGIYDTGAQATDLTFADTGSIDQDILENISLHTSGKAYVQVEDGSVGSKLEFRVVPNHQPSEQQPSVSGLVIKDLSDTLIAKGADDEIWRNSELFSEYRWLEIADSTKNTDSR